MITRDHLVVIANEIGCKTVEQLENFLPLVSQSYLEKFLGFSAEQAAELHRMYPPHAEAPEPPRPVRQAVRGPSQVGEVLEEAGGVAGVGDAAQRRELETEIAREQFLRDNLDERYEQRSVSGPPPGIKYRSHARRRMATKMDPGRWFVRAGFHSVDVVTWLNRGLLSEHPVERAIVMCLRRSLGKPQGDLTEWDVRAAHHLASLAMVLWYSASETPSKGFSAALKGTPRGELARISAHRYRGCRQHPDTISRNLAALRKVLGDERDERGQWRNCGLLMFWQPDPVQALKRGLPHGRGHRVDGSLEVQAVNVYWFVDESFFAKNIRNRTFWVGRPDPASGYKDKQVIPQVSSFGGPLDLSKVSTTASSTASGALQGASLRRPNGGPRAP